MQTIHNCIKQRFSFKKTAHAAASFKKHNLFLKTTWLNRAFFIQLCGKNKKCHTIPYQKWWWCIGCILCQMETVSHNQPSTSQPSRDPIIMNVIYIMCGVKQWPCEVWKMLQFTLYILFTLWYLAECCHETKHFPVVLTVHVCSSTH